MEKIILITTYTINESDKVLFTENNCTQIEIAKSECKEFLENEAILKRLEKPDDNDNKRIWRINNSNIFGYNTLLKEELPFQKNFISDLLDIIGERLNPENEDKPELHLILHDKDISLLENDYPLNDEEINKHILNNNSINKENYSSISAYVFTHTEGDILDLVKNNNYLQDKDNEDIIIKKLEQSFLKKEIYELKEEILIKKRSKELLGGKFDFEKEISFEKYRYLRNEAEYQATIKDIVAKNPIQEIDALFDAILTSQMKGFIYA